MDRLTIRVFCLQKRRQEADIYSLFFAGEAPPGENGVGNFNTSIAANAALADQFTEGSSYMLRISDIEE